MLQNIKMRGHSNRNQYFSCSETFIQTLMPPKVLIRKTRLTFTTTMNIQEILSQLTAKFGNSFDITKVTDALKTFDLKNLSLTDIISKLTASGRLNNAGIDGIKDNVISGLKDKAGSMLGGMFGK